MNKGFSLIEVLVGVFLLLLVFTGIYGAYQLGLKVIYQNKARIGAVSLANQKIEMVRNLPYESVGISGGLPDGVLESATTTVYNNINYNIQTLVNYVVDDKDGIAAPDDNCPNDYKRTGVTVSWSGRFSGSVSLATDISPKDVNQECNEQGGVLSVLVFDSQGAAISSPLIEIKNPLTGQVITSATPTSGQQYFFLATSTYKINVSKSGYSSERTYGVEEIATPEKSHPIVLDKQLVPTSFSIDKLSSFSVDTLSPWGTDDFSDSFDNTSKLSATSNISVSAGNLSLASTTESGYFNSGYAVSLNISSPNLNKWQSVLWSDLKDNSTTTIKYRILYFNGLDWTAVANGDLPGNESGFENPPIDLTGLATTTYPQLRLEADLSTSDASTTPFISSWQIYWTTNESTPIPSVTFELKGNKIIGTDADEQPVYKYSANHTSNSSGHKDILNLEWDLYTFSIDPATGLDLISISSGQPVSLSPDTTLAVTLNFDASNSLLATIQDIETLEPVFSAGVRLYNAGLEYDKTQYTDEKGQTYFIPLENVSYNLEIAAAGYQTALSSVSVSGDETKIIKLERQE